MHARASPANSCEPRRLAICSIYTRCYEVAFSFRDISAEVDVLEACFSRFSEVPVRSVLELGCGTSPHMEELVSRGYQYSGLDVSKAMLEYSRQKAQRIGLSVSLVEADMVDFRLGCKVDVVYIMLGSLYVTSASELATHFRSVAGALRKGGLYFLDWCIQVGGHSSHTPESWEIEKEGMRVSVTVSWRDLDLVEQSIEETILVEAHDQGERQVLCAKHTKRAIYPQEFLCLVRGLKEFEFVGWWNDWGLAESLQRAARINRPITLVRRT
jgi:SAM-dependent methyltransferase